MTITANMVKQLREQTGAGMMECKKALEEARGDSPEAVMQEAVTILRKRGQAKAEKRAGKVAAEGRVLTGISENQEFGLMLEVNCETDFVARDQHFREFAQTLITQGLKHRVKDVASLLGLPNPANPAGTLEQLRQEMIVKIGENIHVRRLAALASPGIVGGYTHSDRIGVLVALDKKNPALAKDIAMHIAAANPVAIDKNAVPADVLAKEKEIYAAQAKESGKPDAIIAKMVEGRLSKYYQEVCLVNQAFIRNPDQTVEALLKAEGAKVLEFIRFAVGEGIEKETVDFAEEVKAQIRGS